MKTWFFRIGKGGDRADQKLYRRLASEFSVAKIGYAVDDEFTKKFITKDGVFFDNIKITEIISELRECLVVRRGILKPDEYGRIEARSRLIQLFVNEMAVGDTIISPFGDRTTKMRIGKVTSKCKTLKKIFDDKKEDICDIIRETPGSEIQGNQKIKPARDVKWETKEMELNDLPDILKKVLARDNDENRIKVFRPTITELKDLENKDILSHVDKKFML